VIFEHWTISDVRFAALISAIFIYAFFGLPTPDDPGVVEAIIAILLIVSVGMDGAVRALTLDMSAPIWRGAGQALLIYGVSISLLVGVFSGKDVQLIIRDILPFLFMMLPIFLTDLFKERSDYFKYLLIAVLILGAVFSLRASSEIFKELLSFFKMDQGEGELTYLANAPTILFAALFLFGLAMQKYVQGYSLKKSHSVSFARDSGYFNSSAYDL
jgi:hypothetical protein